MFSNLAALDLAAMPSLAAGEVRAHRVKLVAATDDTLRGYGHIVPDFTRGHVTIVTWPQPDWRPIVETVACCYAATGKWDEARRCVRQMTGLPELPYAALAPLWERNPHWREKVDDLLRKAGWTETLAADP